jgi:hypothetical protein
MDLETIGLTVLLVGLLAGLTACQSMMAVHHPSIEQQLDVPDNPDMAFRTAVQHTVALGGTIWQQDPRSRTLQSYFEGTTEFSVRVEPRGTASTLFLREQLLPTYFTGGTSAQVAARFLATYPKE